MPRNEEEKEALNARWLKNLVTSKIIIIDEPTQPKCQTPITLECVIFCMVKNLIGLELMVYSPHNSLTRNMIKTRRKVQLCLSHVL